jgi:hypothetical protein
VWRGNCDPPHWTETVGAWAGKWEWVEEWWTTRTKAMAYAVRAYVEALSTGAVTFGYEGEKPEDDPLEVAFASHAAAAGKQLVNYWYDPDEAGDESDAEGKGQQMFVLRKLHPDRKFDIQMAAVLSWIARIDALRANAQPKPRRRSTRVKRLT